MIGKRNHKTSRSVDHEIRAHETLPMFSCCSLSCSNLTRHMDDVEKIRHITTKRRIRKEGFSLSVFTSEEVFPNESFVNEQISLNFSEDYLL
jgi:hypothetical protein